jgi:hypothetical protein
MYSEHEISVLWHKDSSGIYTLSKFASSSDNTWNAYEAGLASIFRFLNECITNDMKVTIMQTDVDNHTNQYIEKLCTIKRKFQFYKDYPYDDRPANEKFLDCNNLKLYFMEKILLDICEDDVKKIGKCELMLHRINVTLIRKQTKKRIPPKDGKPEKLRTVTSNTIESNIDYKIDLIKTNDIRMFFRSIEENGEKQIAVLYYTGFDCSTTTQRIKKLEKNDSTYFETENGKMLTSCSDWKVVTVGSNRIIRDMGNRAVISLSKYLNVTEKFVRAQSFNTLWEMCKTSS